MPKPQKNKRKTGDGDRKTCASTPPALSLSNESVLDPFENFEIELLWCIQQLQSSISSRKMNPRAVEDSMKALNTLKSNKAPLIKKRQIMRTLFGDYRAKMAEEEKKLYKANSNLKFAAPNGENKSKFIKKSSALVSKPKQIDNSSASMNTDAVHASEGISCDKVVSGEALEEKVTLKVERKAFSFKPSGNQFRFNFASSEEDAKS
ncbi:UPF0488 protein CG14286 [Ischnura elegans]|uniref:UPF0488 protein CG14286 n=1 Tax=Ischnura elegans TaxID=197161 RepID=UPI001ED8A60C|nr:UPF0488 protein CG14286 [Ischnura elegans]